MANGNEDMMIKFNMTKFMMYDHTMSESEVLKIGIQEYAAATD